MRTAAQRFIRAINNRRGAVDLHGVRIYIALVCLNRKHGVVLVLLAVGLNDVLVDVDDGFQNGASVDRLVCDSNGESCLSKLGMRQQRIVLPLINIEIGSPPMSRRR